MNEFADHHAKLSDEDLVRIAYFKKAQYKTASRKAAKEELEHRGISVTELQRLKAEVKAINRKERKQKLKSKEEKYGIIDFLLDVFIYGL